MNYLNSQIITIAFLFCLNFNATAADVVAYKTLIVENIYPLKITTFFKPFQLLSKGESKPSFQTCLSEFPEEVVLAYYDAMRMADVKRSNQCWAPDSLRQMQDRDRQSGLDDAHWRQLWQKNYANDFSLSVVKQVEYGQFIIVQVNIKDQNGKITKDDFALERIGKLWKLTQKLAADPVLQYWDSDKTRVQVAPQSWLPLSK